MQQASMEKDSSFQREEDQESAAESVHKIRLQEERTAETAAGFGCKAFGWTLIVKTRQQATSEKEVGVKCVRDSSP